jgi:uracil-DNA glycosylase
MCHLNSEFNKEYHKNLIQYIKNEYNKFQIFPKFEDIFRAFDLTCFDEVKVVILGQDPYHGIGQANGLAFSTNLLSPVPKSLHNIFIELNHDMGIKYPEHCDLTTWAKQGVLLLNTVLTVRSGQPGSHRSIGWEKFTDQVIFALNKKTHPIIYMLWGKEAQKKKELIDTTKHIVLVTSHPSPLSAYRGFLGCKHFSKTNALLIENGLTPINWQL